MLRFLRHLADRGGAVAMIGLLAGTGPSAMASVDAVKDLPGRWSGWGRVVLANGASEQVKCVATYFLERAGERVQQNLRCASGTYKIDASAQLVLKGAQVSGIWEEKTWSATGEVSGKIHGNAFDLSIRGPNFTAAMAVTTSPCQQAISISPSGLDIARISIGLGKC